MSITRIRLYCPSCGRESLVDSFAPYLNTLTCGKNGCDAQIHVVVDTNEKATALFAYLDPNPVPTGLARIFHPGITLEVCPKHGSEFTDYKITATGVLTAYCVQCDWKRARA